MIRAVGPVLMLGVLAGASSASQTASLTPLGYLNTDTSSRADSASSDGSVVVGSSISTYGGFEAFRWSAREGKTALGYLPGALASHAMGISGDGSMVVGWSGSQAFRWTARGMTGLGFLPGGSESVAWAISSSGSVIVGDSTSDASTFFSATKHSAGRAATA